MDWKLFWVFVALNVANVIIQTVKSLATVKCGKWIAAGTNAAAYFLYTFVVVYMVSDLNIWVKASVIGGANLIGVLIVKTVEERIRRDRLWKVEATVQHGYSEKLNRALIELGISHNYIVLEPKSNFSDVIFNIYCPTQKQSHAVRELLNGMYAKYFVSESKSL